jgi:DNA polymerase-3 subunit delta
VKYDNLRAFEKHIEAAGPLHLSRLYLLLSKESEHKEPADKILTALFPSGHERELAVKILEGSSITVDELALELQGLSFFVKKQAFWIKNCDKCKKEVLGFIEEYLPKIPPAQYLILSATAWNKQTKFYKTAEKEGVIFEAVEVKPWEKEKQLVEWAGQQLAEERKTMPYQALQELVKQTGCNQALLKQELEKLLTFAADKNEITFQEAAKICTFGHADTIWQLGEAIFKRETAKAIKIASDLLSDASLLPCLRQIRSQFQTHFHIGVALSKGMPAQEAAGDFPYMKGAFLNKTVDQIRHYGVRALQEGLLLIDETEIKVKNSQTEEKLLLELLIIRLTQGAKK